MSMSAFQEVARTTAIFGLWFIVIPVAIEAIHIIINYYKNQKGSKNNVAKNFRPNSQGRNSNRNI